jgi:ATP-dependent DNA helicase RecQ
MLLSAVYRTGQRFGTAHINDVLLGSLTANVAKHQHAEISVFGIGSERSSQSWRSVVRQLIVQGYLRSDADRYGALVLTDRSRGLLRGETPVRLRLDPKRPLAAKTKATRVASPISDQDRDLWDALRACRQALASEHGVPPYVIFHDSTLRQMLERRPQDETELLALNGVGQTKLERYGEAFLAILRHPQP